ncbi:MAG TPA: hypothetical protein VF126_03540 [Acidobacteriaceae bacterium]
MPAGQGIHRYQHRNDLQMAHRSYLSVFRVVVAAVLAAAAVAVVMFTYRWPLIGDAQTLASDPTGVIVLSNMRFYRT